MIMTKLGSNSTYEYYVGLSEIRFRSFKQSVSMIAKRDPTKNGRSNSLRKLVIGDRKTGLHHEFINH